MKYFWLKLLQLVILKPPSFKLVQFVILFRISLAITLLVGVLFLSGCSSSVSATSWWQPVGSSRLALLAKQAIAENTQLNPDSFANVLAMNIPANKQQDRELFLLNYNTNNLCGKLGCLYSIYSQQGQTYKLIWSKYLQPNLPKGESLFTFSHDASNNPGFACLEVKQMQGNHLQKLIYCFDGKTYRLVNSELFNKTY